MRQDRNTITMTRQEYDDEYLVNQVKGYARGRLDADSNVVSNAEIIKGFVEFYMARRQNYMRNDQYKIAWEHYIMSLELLKAMNYR